MPKSAATLVSEAMGRIESLDADQAAREIAGGNALVVDVREPHELAEHGRIRGAVHVPRGMLEFRADPETPHYLDAFDRTRRVILYCAVGSRSSLACISLQELGYGRVANLDGGFDAWKAAGHPVEQA